MSTKRVLRLQHGKRYLEGDVEVIVWKGDRGWMIYPVANPGDMRLLSKERRARLREKDGV